MNTHQEKWATRIAALAVWLVVAMGVCGCSAVLKTNARIAGAMVEIQERSESVIRRGRVEASVAAARAVRDSGGDIEAAVEAADGVRDRWSCAIDGHQVYSIAVGTYVDTLTLVSVGGEFEFAMVVPLLGRALATYRELRECSERLGLTIFRELPQVLEQVPTEWNVAGDGEEEAVSE